MRLERWICSCLLAAAVATTAQAATFFVDAAGGSDANPGISAAQPFQTIQRAIEEATGQPGPDRIQIAAGTYVENLRIEDAGSLALSGSGGVEIVAANTSQDAVSITLGDVTISDLQVGGGRHGIAAAGAPEAPLSLALRNVDSIGNSLRGLNAEDALDVVISACQFLDNGTDGIKVRTRSLDRTRANLTVRDTIVSGNGDDGVDLELLCDVSLTNVMVLDTRGDDGLSIDDSVSISIVGCVFENSGADGMDIDDTESVSIISTASMNNAIGGMQIKAEEDYDIQSIQIVGSDFLNNGADGVWICEDGTVVEQASLSSVTAIGNGGRGLNIAVTAAVKLSAITSEGNGQDDVLP